MSPSRALQQAIDDCTRVVRKLREEKAELVTLLGLAVRLLTHKDIGFEKSPAVEEMRAAIAKAKGES